MNTSLHAHGGQMHRIAERFGISSADLLDFSANINPDGPPASVLDALREVLNNTAILTQYPDLEETQLRLGISTYTSAAPETIVVANGFVPLLDAVLRTTPIRNCLLPVPAFGEYRRALERAGVTVTPYILDAKKDFRYPAEDLLATLATGRHDAILLANPQNPSGVLYERANLIAFLEETFRRNIYVLLDEAFIDYAPFHSMVNETERFPNLIVFRSVTKFHGIPGLRVAYAVAANTVACAVRQNLAPWSITTLAAIAVRAALADIPYANITLSINHQRKTNFVEQINELGLHSYPAAANFLLLRFPTDAAAETCWERLILDYGIVLRRCSNFEGITHNHLRCAIRNEEQNARLIKALAPKRIFGSS
jgi:threonine-phosphate decarboxylase